jgi:hypothetical protein
MIQRGWLNAFQLGGPHSPIRITADDLEEFLTGENPAITALKQEIFEAFDRGDEDELRRLQARYRAEATVRRPLHSATINHVVRRDAT